MADVLGFFKKIMPWAAAAATSVATGTPVPLLTKVAQEVSKATDKKVDNTVDSLSAAIAGATPDQLIQIKKIDDDFALQMQQAGFQNDKDLETIFAADRASARDRQIKMGDRFPQILTIALLVAFCALIYCLIRLPIPSASQSILYGMAGTLSTALVTAVAYFLGSSKGSADKTQLLAQAPPIQK